MATYFGERYAKFVGGFSDKKIKDVTAKNWG